MTTKIKGIPASNGIAIAKVFLLEQQEINIEKKEISDPEKEIKRLEEAIQVAKNELEAIKKHTLQELGKEKAEIFAAHLLVLEDPELIKPVKDRIQNEKVNAEFSLQETATMFIQIFEKMDNEYMKERAADIRDVVNRVQAHLTGVSLSNPSMISEEVIVIAEDLTPSDTAQLNRKYVKGFATDIGGRTSHSAIMARSLEIPAVVGTKNITEQLKNDMYVIVDGINGEIIVNPTTEIVNEYEEKRKQYEWQKEQWAKLVHEKTTTSDGFHVELAANIGTPEDVKGALNNGAEGIGLYRTEFLYMGRNQLPTEDEQFEAYKTVLEKMGDKPVVVRTLDIGGDKELPYLHLPKELNPFLGFRAIRLCLEEQEIFRTQLRALLRASTYGNLKIMFPMIATLEEFRKAKAILLEEKEALQKSGEKISESIELGIMVEIPSTAVLADQFATEVDFFSIGTNDLIQYTMAADRMNERVSYLYQPYHPSILRLINMVIQAAHAEGKWVGMCGEMAGDEIAIPILLGLGLDEFSMSASSILPARSQLLGLSKEKAAQLAQEVLHLKTADDVKNYVWQATQNV